MLAQKPPMGWNSWNTFGKDISEALIMEIADVMVEKGYKDAGYEYVIIDDCWSLKERDENGRLVPDPEKFPHGMKYLADYIHSKGLKFGMYSCAGVMTCAAYPSSYGHEYVDAATFAEWEIDYLKYDFCFFPKSGNCRNAYLTMSMALRSCGREILFAACNWGVEEPWTWMRSIGVHTYRSTGDIFDNFKSFRDIAQSQCKNLSMSAPGCYNDIDMLIAGMYGKGNVGIESGCTDDEYTMHFALWSLYSAPLIMGADIRSVNEVSEKLMKNRGLITINQDAEARPPFIVSDGENWSKCCALLKILSGNEYAIGFFNFADEENSYYGLQCNAFLTDMGVPYESGMALDLTDVLTGEKLGKVRDLLKIDVRPHSCRILKGSLVHA